MTSFQGENFFTAYTDYPGKDWTVGVTISVSDYMKTIRFIKQTTFSLVIAAILLASLLSYLLAMTIIRPLHSLQQGIERISRGDLDYKVAIEDPDIASALACSFNQMAFSLQKSLVELKLTYAELAEKEKLAAVGKMTAGIAHEIKNPLGVILGSAQIVVNRERPWEMREKAARFIIDEVARLDNTLKSFLAFARPPSPTFQETDMIRLLEDTLSATEERYLEEGYTIVRDFPAARTALPGGQRSNPTGLVEYRPQRHAVHAGWRHNHRQAQGGTAPRASETGERSDYSCQPLCSPQRLADHLHGGSRNWNCIRTYGQDHGSIRQFQG